ncbi:MAG: HK97 gp10 family phage protein [Simkania sp.]|nr:HK97 gp10 family phage protein [Simkania sp.]
MTTNFHNQPIELIEAELRHRMEKVVRIVRNKVVSLISTKVGVTIGPKGGKKKIRSLPGEPPRLDTGQLRRSIATQVSQEGNDIVGRIGTNVYYAKYLENPLGLNRQFLTPAAQQTLNQVRAILEAPM